MTTVTEEEYRELAWVIIGRLSVSELLGDCVDALIETYKTDEELFLADKKLLGDEDVDTEQYWTLSIVSSFFMVIVY